MNKCNTERVERYGVTAALLESGGVTLASTENDDAVAAPHPAPPPALRGEGERGRPRYGSTHTPTSASPVMRAQISAGWQLSGSGSRPWVAKSQ